MTCVSSASWPLLVLVSEFFSKCISCRENWPKLMDMTHILQDSGEHDTNFVFGNVS